MGLKSFFTKALSPYINLYNFRTGALQQFPITIGQPAVYPPQETQSYIDAYTTNASVYTIVSTIANKFGYIPRYVYQIEDSEAAEAYQKYIKTKGFDFVKAVKLHKKAYKKADSKIKVRYKNYSEQEVDNALADLLKTPNDQQGQDSFFELQDIFYELTGECFIWLNRGDSFLIPTQVLPDGTLRQGEMVDVTALEGTDRLKIPPIELYVFSSNDVAFNVNRNTMTGEIINYILIRNGQQTPIPKEDIIHWKKPNPKYDYFNFTHLRGLSPLAAGLKLYTADNAAMDAQVAMHQNDGAKGVLYNETLDKLTPVQKSAADDAIDNKINNRNLKSAVAMLPGKWGYLYTGQNAVDLDLGEAMDKMFSRLCNLYQVNPNFFVSGQTFDNLEQARKDFITQTIMPRACSNRDELNRSLLIAFGLDPKKYTIDIDITNLPEMQDDMGKLVTSLAAAWWLSPNEKLEQMNEEKSTDPNMDKVWIPNNLILMDDAAVPMPTLDGFTGQPVPNSTNGLSGGTSNQSKPPGSNGSTNQGGNKPKPASNR